MAPTFSQVIHVHDLALRDPAQVAPEVLLQLLLLPQLLEGPPGLGLLPLLGEFPAGGRGAGGGGGTSCRDGVSWVTEPLLRLDMPILLVWVSRGSGDLPGPRAALPPALPSRMLGARGPPLLFLLIPSHSSCLVLGDLGQGLVA